MRTKKIDSYEAKTHLSALLESVSKGESVIITRKGVPIAILSPYREEQPSVTETIKALRSFRKNNQLKGLSIQEMREEGRRF